MKNSYKSKQELLIDALLEKADWQDLLMKNWRVYNKFELAYKKADLIKENHKVIKNTWLSNPKLSLPTVLVSLDIMSMGEIANSDTANQRWLIESLEDLITTSDVPQQTYRFCLCNINRFGFKMSKPKWYVINNLTNAQLKRLGYDSEL